MQDTVGNTQRVKAYKLRQNSRQKLSIKLKEQNYTKQSDSNKIRTEDEEEEQP